MIMAQMWLTTEMHPEIGTIGAVRQARSPTGVKQHGASSFNVPADVCKEKVVDIFALIAKDQPSALLPVPLFHVVASTTCKMWSDIKTVTVRRARCC